MASLRARFALWLAAVAALGAAYGFGVAGRMHVETDLLAMLPQVERDPLIEEAVRHLAATTGRRTLFLVGAPDLTRARAAAGDLAAALRASQVFSGVTLEVAGGGAALGALYDAHRDVLLSDTQRRALERGEGGRLAQDAIRTLYTPSGWLRARPFAQDPLNLYGDFLAQQLPLAGHVRLEGDLLVAPSPQGPYVLVTAETRAEAFSLSSNERLESVIAGSIAAVTKAHAGTQVLCSGVVRYAAAATARGKAELTLFGSVSLGAIVILILLTFRGLRPLLLSLMSIGVGTLAALTAAQFLFERVHLITLVFGSTITGVSVDYSIHYFADQFRFQDRWDPRETLHHVGGAILIGMLATVLGYLALLSLPFPGLRQMAVFSIVGVVAACATVLLAYPALANRRPAPHRPAALALARRLGDLPSSGRLPAPSLAAIALLALACGVGVWRLSFVDDIRALQSTPDWLRQQDARVRALLGGGADTRFFLVEGPDAEAALRNEERLRDGLDALVADGRLAGYQAVSRVLPSRARQAQVRQALATQVYGEHGALARVLQAAGYSSAEAARRRAELPAAPQWLTPQEWLASEASAPLRDLWLEPVSAPLHRGAATAVTLSGVGDLAALQALAARTPGVTFVDRVARISEVLRRFRQLASAGLLAAFTIVGLVLVARYGPRVGLRLMVAPLGGAALTLGTLGLLGVPANLFNILALLLVLGMGVDYAVFMREGHAARATVIMAILLAGLMTLLSFGMLALSTTPFIRSLGLTVDLGVTFTFVLALFTSGTSADAEGAAGAPVS